jgi:hypothetical protein
MPTDEPQHREVPDRQAVRGEQLLRELLVHAGGAGQHARSDVGHAGHLQQPLDRAVLAEGTVQHREDDVHAAEHLTGPARLEHHQPTASGVARQHDGGGRRVHGRQRAAVDRELLGVVGAQHPGTVAGDADRHDVEPLAVEVAQHAARRDTGDGVLTAAAAEHDRHPGAPRRLGHGR